MNSEPPTDRGAAAGALIVAAVVLCGGAGLALGALVGATALLTIAGVCAGFAVGFALVYVRFRDL